MINTRYTRLLTAYAISSMGDWLYRLAVPLLIYQMTQSALSMSIAYALTFLPYILVTPLGGVIADRLSRRQLLIVGDVAAAILTAMLGVLFYLTQTTTLIELMGIYFLVFCVASVTSLYHPAFQSFLPEIVEAERLPRANSLITSCDNLFTFLGPLLGGTAVALLGGYNSIYINALSFLLSALLIKTIPSSGNIVSHRFTVKSVIRDLKEGFASVWSNTAVKFGCFIFLIANFGIQIFYANFMYFLVHMLALTPAEVGFTIALTGLGAILGSLIAPQFISRFTEGRIIISCLTLSGLITFFLLNVHHAWQVALAWGCVSASNSVVIVTYFTLRQRAVARELLGRTIAITRLISYTAIPIASVCGGWMIQHTHHMQGVILLSGIALTASGLLGWLTPLNQRKNNMQPAIT